MQVLVAVPYRKFQQFSAGSGQLLVHRRFAILHGTCSFVRTSLGCLPLFPSAVDGLHYIATPMIDQATCEFYCWLLAFLGAIFGRTRDLVNY